MAQELDLKITLPVMPFIFADCTPACSKICINNHITIMKEQAILQNLNDFDNKSLLIVDDDNPFRERLARAMEKKRLPSFTS